MDLKSLPALTVLSDCVTIVQQDNVKIVRVIHDKATAGISLFGGHVVSFKPSGQEDFIFMSSDAKFDGKAALRGGIPVCWPWFGPQGKPSHGFARNSDWELLEHRESEAGVIVSLGLKSNDDTLALWPNKFAARLNVEVSETLKVTLEMTNTDDKAWTFTGALHTYLNVGDIHKVTTTGMGAEYIDKMQDSKVCQGGDELVITDTVDRVYTKPDAIQKVSDPAFNRTLVVENSGHNSVVIWNPWEAGAQSMGDMNDDGFNNMICVESVSYAETLAQGQSVQPGESYSLTSTLSAE